MGALAEREPGAEVVAGERQGRRARSRERVVGVGGERRVIGALGARVEARVPGLARALVVGVAEAARSRSSRSGRAATAACRPAIRPLGVGAGSGPVEADGGAGRSSVEEQCG